MQRWTRIFQKPGILLALLCVATYGGTLLSEFKIDDFSFINKDFFPHVSSAFGFFTQSINLHYHPLNILLNDFLFDRLGGHVLPFHLFNLSLFYLNCLLLFYLALALTKNHSVSLVAAVLFCLHPMNAEIVNQITFCSVLLAGCLLQTSVLLYDRFLFQKDQKLYFFAVILALLSCLTLETSWILPFYLFMWAVFIRKVTVKRALITTCPFWVISLVLLLVWRGLSHGNSLSGGILSKIATLGLTPVNFMGTLCFLIFWYVQKLLIPIDHIWIYGVKPLSIGLSWAYLGLAFFAASFIAILLLKAREKNLFILLLIWFFGALLFLPPGSLAHPEAGLVVEPYWFFVGSMSFFIAAGICLNRLQGQLPMKVFYIILVLLSFSLFYLTQRFNGIAKTQKTYSEYWMRISPNQSPLTALAKTAFDQGDFPLAIKYYDLYLKEFAFSPYAAHQPDQIFTTLGFCYLNLDDSLKAWKMVDNAMDWNGQYAKAFDLKGMLEIHDNKRSEAEKSFQRAYALDHQDSFSLMNLADLYITAKEHQKAIDVLEKLTQGVMGSEDRIKSYSRLAVLDFLYVDVKRSNQVIEELLKEDSSPEAFKGLAKEFASFHQLGPATLFLKQGQQLYPNDKRLIKW